MHRHAEVHITSQSQTALGMILRFLSTTVEHHFDPRLSLHRRLSHLQ